MKKDNLEFDYNRAENDLYAAGCCFSDELFLIKSKKEREKLLKEFGLREEDYYIEKKKQGCYIATCVYGSYDCPSVWVLRRYRDQFLRKHWLGRLFIDVYYSISPILVQYFGNTHWFQKLFKKILDPFVQVLIEYGYDNSFFQDK